MALFEQLRNGSVNSLPRDGLLPFCLFRDLPWFYLRLFS